MKTAIETDPTFTRKRKVKVAVLLLSTLLLFLFAINLMVASLTQLGENMAHAILFATANPFTGLFIGLLITAMLQSSSTTTSLVVAFVASGAITVNNAVPIIMGANIGTTITSTIVSLGFINQKKEFKRAFSAGTCHDFFNILTVIILFPLEYYYGFLSGTATYLTHQIFNPVLQPVEQITPGSAFGLGALNTFLLNAIPAVIVALISLALLFTSIVIFRKMVSDLLQVGNPQMFKRFFFKTPIKSFGWGMLITAAIRSSTITTSIVVPMVAKRITKLKYAAPFIMGANIGTTITAFIAVMLYANTQEAVTIALVHFLFNLCGVLIFFPTPFLRTIPLKLAAALGKLMLRYRFMGLVYLLCTFFLIPFALIYANIDLEKRKDLINERKPLPGIVHFSGNTEKNR